jgi:hypothetical protein
MANLFSRLTSIHGRRIAMSATGAIVDKNGFGAVMADSSGVLQTTIKSAVEVISSSGAVLLAYGMSYFSSATSTARAFTISAPSTGQEKVIFSLSSATTLVLETTATGIYFVSTGASSTALTFSSAGGVFGESVTLMGLSSTRWAVLKKSDQVV